MTTVSHRAVHITMLFLISPAKALDYETPSPTASHTQPLFAQRSAELIEVLREKSPQQIAELMHLSDALSGLNVARYQSWSPKFTTKNSKQAALAFDGDVYGGLDATSLAQGELDWLQQHVCILSGLYGVLRPLDLMQPYRLEMGTRLETPRGKNLYQFWGSDIAQYLNQRAAAAAAPSTGVAGWPGLPAAVAKAAPKARTSTRESAGEAFMKSAMRSVGSNLGRQVVRGLLGSIFKR